MPLVRGSLPPRPSSPVKLSPDGLNVDVRRPTYRPPPASHPQRVHTAWKTFDPRQFQQYQMGRPSTGVPVVAASPVRSMSTGNLRPGSPALSGAGSPGSAASGVGSAGSAGSSSPQPRYNDERFRVSPKAKPAPEPVQPKYEWQPYRKPNYFPRKSTTIAKVEEIQILAHMGRRPGGSMKHNAPSPRIHLGAPAPMAERLFGTCSQLRAAKFKHSRRPAQSAEGELGPYQYVGA